MKVETIAAIAPILIGLIYVIAGFITLKFPFKKMDSFCGFRTSSAMKSKERWDFEQKIISKEMIKLGILLAIAGFIVFIFLPKGIFGMIIGLCLITSVLIILTIKVKSATKKKFNKN